MTDSGRSVSYHTQRPLSLRDKEIDRVADLSPYPGAPRWLRMFGIAVGIVALLLVVLIHTGGAPHQGMSFFGGASYSAAGESRH